MLAYLFLSKVATLTQSNSFPAIFPYVQYHLTAGIAAFAGISVFASIAVIARLRRLDVMTIWQAK